MKLSKRHRLNITIDGETSHHLLRLSRRMGFRSPSAMGAACVSMVVRLCMGAPEEEQKDEETIRTLFAEMAQWQVNNGNRHDMNQRR